MKKALFGLVLVLANGLAWADDRSACEDGFGVYRSGTVTRQPKFAHGQYRRGIELSHTHVSLLADQDQRTYDVAIDNVFANGFDPNKPGIPAPLDKIREGDRIGVCGALYTRGVGIHFVHANCDKDASPAHPDGWIKLGAGSNLEANTAYCPLFQGHSRKRR